MAATIKHSKASILPSLSNVRVKADAGSKKRQIPEIPLVLPDIAPKKTSKKSSRIDLWITKFGAGCLGHELANGLADGVYLRGRGKRKLTDKTIDTLVGKNEELALAQMYCIQLYTIPDVESGHPCNEAAKVVQRGQRAALRTLQRLENKPYRYKFEFSFANNDIPGGKRKVSRKG